MAQFKARYINLRQTEWIKNVLENTKLPWHENASENIFAAKHDYVNADIKQINLTFKDDKEIQFTVDQYH